jgi:hypothetical protein
MRILSLAATAACLTVAPMFAMAATDDTPVPGAPDAPLQALSNLVRHVQTIWNPACDVKGFRDTHPDIRFALGKDGNIANGPDWTNPNTNKAWQTAADRGKAAILHGQPYVGLPESLYGRPIVITFDARQACN